MIHILYTYTVGDTFYEDNFYSTDCSGNAYMTAMNTIEPNNCMVTSTDGFNDF